MKMKIAVPLDNKKKVYHANPWTAPSFAIYTVTEEDENLIYDCIAEKENPWIEENASVICDTMTCADGCSDVVKADLSHLSDHYIILEAVHGCTYLVAETYCSNVEKVLENSGINIYRLPPIVKEPDLAIKNLLVNLKYTNSVQKVKKAPK
jgi:predicted Fe-Mo cluster-binding NifX family protein